MNAEISAFLWSIGLLICDLLNLKAMNSSWYGFVTPLVTVVYVVLTFIIVRLSARKNLIPVLFIILTLFTSVFMVFVYRKSVELNTVMMWMSVAFLTPYLGMTSWINSDYQLLCIIISVINTILLIAFIFLHRSAKKQ